MTMPKLSGMLPIKLLTINPLYISTGQLHHSSTQTELDGSDEGLWFTCDKDATFADDLLPRAGFHKNDCGLLVNVLLRI